MSRRDTGCDPTPTGYTNVQRVHLNGDCRVVVSAPEPSMSKREALVHAAWIVATADDRNEFAEVLSTVRLIRDGALKWDDVAALLNLFYRAASAPDADAQARDAVNWMRQQHEGANDGK